MKAKDIASQLGSLAAAASSQPGNYDTNDIDTDIPDELQEPDPIFVVEHEEVMSADTAKALKSVKQIVNTIVPAAYQENPIIKDKILQDADQLGQLYYQQSMNNVMIKVIMDTISKGDTSAKLFDSYTKLMSIAKDFNKQINEMQNQFRKYYIDTYLDLQHKEDEDLIAEDNGVNRKLKPTITNQEPQQVTYEEVEQSHNESNMDLRETSTKDTTLKVQDWKKEIYRKKFEESKKAEG